MDPLAAKLILDEIRKINRMFDESDARMERCFSRTLATLKQQSGAVELRSVDSVQVGATQLVVADNWGGLFDGDGDSVEQQGEAPEERYLDSSIDVFDSDPQIESGFTFSDPARPSIFPSEKPARVTKECDDEPAIFNSASPLLMAEQLVVDAAAAEFTSINLVAPPDPLLCDRLSRLPDALLRNIVSRLSVKDAARTAVLSRRWTPLWRAVLTLSLAQIEAKPHFFLAQFEQDMLHGGGKFVSVGVNIQRHYNIIAPAPDDATGLLRCIHLGPVECALHAVQLGGYDSSFDDDPESGFAHLDTPLDRAVGRFGQALEAAAALHADAVGAAGGGLLAWVVAAESAPATCSTVCPAGNRNFAGILVGALWAGKTLPWNDDNHGPVPVSYVATLELCNISTYAKLMAAATGSTSMLPRTPCSSTPTWAYAEVVNSLDKRPWPPPSQAAVISEQGMDKLVVVTLPDAKLNVKCSKPLWPSPDMQVEFECGSDYISPISWPSFTSVVHELAFRKYYNLSSKPPWPPPVHHYLRIVYAEIVESWKHKMVITVWSLHVLIQEELQQQFVGEAITDLSSCTTTIALLLLELLKLKENWQCAVCLEPTHLGVTIDCFPDGYFIPILCCVVQAGCDYMSNDINVLVLSLAGEIIQEQKPRNHKGCSSNTNLIDDVSVGIAATLWLFPVGLPHWLCFHFLWKPPWRIPALVAFIDDCGDLHTFLEQYYIAFRASTDHDQHVSLPLFCSELLVDYEFLETRIASGYSLLPSAIAPPELHVLPNASFVDEADLPTDDIVIIGCGEFPEAANDGIVNSFKDGDMYLDWQLGLVGKPGKISWWMEALESATASTNESFKKQDYKAVLRKYSQSMRLLLSSVDKQLWPPPMQISKMLCTARVPSAPSMVDRSIQSCFLLPSCCRWVAVLYTQPWPPPVQFEIQAAGVQFRFLDSAEFGTMPWPFPAVVWLSNWLWFHLAEFIDAGRPTGPVVDHSSGVLIHLIKSYGTVQLIQAGVLLLLMQWPSFCCSRGDKKSKLWLSLYPVADTWAVLLLWRLQEVVYNTSGLGASRLSRRGECQLHGPMLRLRHGPT